MLIGSELLEKCSGFSSPPAARTSQFAKQWAMKMASELPGLDLTPQSVSVIEQTILKLREENTCDTAEEFDDVAGFFFYFGLVYGETLRQAINGKWVAADSALGMPLAVEAREGKSTMVWNPIGKVFKMLDDPKTDSVLAFFDHVVKNPMGP